MAFTLGNKCTNKNLAIANRSRVSCTHNTLRAKITSSPSKPPKTSFLGTYNGKPMENTYPHNCMMHRDTMLKFGALFDLVKYFEHT